MKGRGSIDTATNRYFQLAEGEIDEEKHTVI
jgi:hypothetical protein